jgi:hypothetical protein
MQGVGHAMIHVRTEKRIRQEFEKLPDHRQHRRQAERQQLPDAVRYGADGLLCMPGSRREKIGGRHAGGEMGRHVDPGMRPVRMEDASQSDK